MTKIQKLVEGLQIILKYEDDKIHSEVAAVHDKLFAGTDRMSEDDSAKMRSLGWGLDETMGCWYIFL